VTIFVRLEDGAMKDVSFQGSGCAISTASASMMTEKLKGKTAEEALSLFEGFHDLVTGSASEGTAPSWESCRSFPACRNSRSA
jgi:nitrogen fixation NifU-like protein